MIATTKLIDKTKKGVIRLEDVEVGSCFSIADNPSWFFIKGLDDSFFDLKNFDGLCYDDLDPDNIGVEVIVHNLEMIVS